MKTLEEFVEAQKKHPIKYRKHPKKSVEIANKELLDSFSVEFLAALNPTVNNFDSIDFSYQDGVFNINWRDDVHCPEGGKFQVTRYTTGGDKQEWLDTEESFQVQLCRYLGDMPTVEESHRRQKQWEEDVARRAIAAYNRA